MDSKTKGYIALGVAALFAIKPITVYLAAQKMVSEGRLQRNTEGEETFNKAVGMQLVFPGLAMIYGLSQLGEG